MSLNSSIGKINDVVLIYTIDSLSYAQLVPSTSNPKRKVPAIYNDLDNKISSIGARLFILFNGTEELLNQMTRTAFSRLIPFNYKLPQGTSVTYPKSWTQDVFELCPSTSKLVFSSGFNFLYEQMNRYVLENKFSIGFNYHLTESGNVLTGTFQKKKYLVLSKRINKEINPENFVDCYRDNCFIELEYDMPESLCSIFYHVDMFLAIIGEVEVPEYKGYEVFLMGQAEGEDTEVVEAVNNLLSDIEKQLVEKGKKAGINVKIVHVPFMILNTGNEIWGLPLVNCLVENFSQNKKQIIRLLVPDFVQAFKDYYRTAEFSRIQKLNELLGINNSSLSPKSLVGMASILARQASDELHARLEKKLFPLGISKEAIIRVQCDFYNMAMNSHAGLHCLVKVVKRS